jgi:hypothetical protein
MFCTNCGKEVPPGNQFCPNCGTQVEQAQAQTGAPPVAPPPAASPPPAGAPGGAEKAPGKKKWVIPLVVVVSLLVIAAVVLALIFFVFGGGNTPEDAANVFFQAIEQKDAQLIIDNTDLSSLGDEPGVEGKFKKYVRDSMPSDSSLEFTGLEYKTKESGENATVEVIAGKATATDKDGKKETTEISEEGSNTFFLVKKDGNWLYTVDTFPDFSASLQMKEADQSLRKLELAYATLKKDVEGVFDEMSTATAQSFAELDALYKKQQEKADAQIDKFLDSAEAAKSEYEEISDLKGVAEYQGYANLRSSQIDKYIEIGTLFKEFLNELGGLTASWVTNPPTSEAALQQAVEGIINSYESRFDQLENEAGELGEQADALSEGLNL